MTADDGTDVFLGHGRTGQVIRHQQVRAEKHSQLINAELAHRIQNTLTIINSI
jgi:two-component sensor histidine kinase